MLVTWKVTSNSNVLPLQSWISQTDEYNIRVLYIANLSFILGDKLHYANVSVKYCLHHVQLC